MLDWFDHHGHICIAFEMLGLSVFEFMVRSFVTSQVSSVKLLLIMMMMMPTMTVVGICDCFVALYTRDVVYDVCLFLVHNSKHSLLYIHDITRAAIQSLEIQIWRLATSTKLKLYNTCILPVFLYGSDCWAISKTDARGIDAVDQWCLRLLLGIKWY